MGGLHETDLSDAAWDDVRDIVRRCRLPPESVDTVAAALARLAQEIAADMAVPDAERRARRSERLSTLEALAAALRRCPGVVETAPPHAAADLRRLLASVIGRYFSSAAFGDLVDEPVSPTLSWRDQESRAATSRAGPYSLLEEYARAQREEAASWHGDRLLATLTGRLAEPLEAALRVERLDTGGRPAVRARRIALIRLAQLHVELSGRPLSAGPTRAFLDFAEGCFAAMGLPPTTRCRARPRCGPASRRCRPTCGPARWTWSWRRAWTV